MSFQMTLLQLGTGQGMGMFRTKALPALPQLKLSSDTLEVSGAVGARGVKVGGRHVVEEINYPM